MLERTSEPMLGKRIALDRDTITIGRDDGKSLVIDHLSVSLRHAELVRKGKLWVVIDLGSSNGTFVEGRKVQENALKPGFTVEFGQVKFKFVE